MTWMLNYLGLFAIFKGLCPITCKKNLINLLQVYDERVDDDGKGIIRWGTLDVGIDETAESVEVGGDEDNNTDGRDNPIIEDIDDGGTDGDAAINGVAA
jgi:hypothetical protein